MYFTRFNQRPSTPSLPSTIVASTQGQYFDSPSCESPDNVDWDLFPMAESIMPVCTTTETTLDSLPRSFELLPTGPQTSFDVGVLDIQSVEIPAVIPRTASSSFGQGVGHVDGMLLSDSAALVSPVSEDGNEVTPVCDTPGMSSGTDSGNVAATAIDQPRFVCQTCGRSYSRPASLNRHMQAKHHSVMHSCSYCHKTYDRSDNMKRHEKTHRKASQDSPSSGRATRLQSPAIRPTGISKSRRGGRVPAGSWEQQGSPKMNSARAQRAMQLMGELFLIMGGSNLEAQA